jgi:RNA polymerase sigma-70 factor (ECF subfamily)
VTTTQLQQDRALAKRVAAGDAGAFDAFFREYFPRLFRFTMTRVGNDEGLAEEIVQRTMCLVVRKMAAYRGEALLFTWLCRICRNEMAAVFRQRGIAAERNVPLEDKPAVQAALESMSADLDGPEDLLGNEELARFVRVTLEYLPARYSAALEMKYLQGYSVIEIGDALNMSSKAAESMLTRARAAFREGFRSLHDLEPELLLR